MPSIEGQRCRVCGRPDDSQDRVCRECRRLPLEERAEGGAPFIHDGTAMKLVYALKYGGVRAAAIPLAYGMAGRLPECVDALVPVPLHRRRLRERGFNQARVLCEEIVQETGLPILDALERTVATKQQMKLGADERRVNVAGAFEVVEPVAGLRLVLVDDVRTTGMTAKACAKALYENGALDVYILTATLAMLNIKR